MSTSATANCPRSSLWSAATKAPESPSPWAKGYPHQARRPPGLHLPSQLRALPLLRGWQAHLCTEIEQIKTGDTDPRFSQDGIALNAQSPVGTFAEHAIVKATSCVVIDKDISMDVAALLGCAIPTGYGAAVHAGKVQPGDHVIVVGMGGVGTNAVQGAKVVGASTVVAVDLSPQ
nr:hypothetical protein [Glutamicibacter arilaitensis]